MVLFNTGKRGASLAMRKAEAARITYIKSFRTIL
jgi:hypothetical protein